MNPKIWCIKNNVPGPAFIREMQKKYPKYSKAAHSLASRPYETGITLTASAGRYIGGKKENRTLPCRVSFRLSERNRERLTWAKELLSFSTDQALMDYIVAWFLREMEKAAPTGGAVEAAKEIVTRPL